MPMKIFVDVAEAAEGFEELVGLAYRHDEVYVCRGERAVAQLTALSGTNELSRAETASGVEGGDRGSKPAEGCADSSIDGAWALAAEGEPRRVHDTTSGHDDLYDDDGLPL